MKLLHGAAGVEDERESGTDILLHRLPFGEDEFGFALRVARRHIGSVEARRPFGALVVAGPLDATEFLDLFVAHAAVVAETPFAHLFPLLEGIFGLTPPFEEQVVFALEVFTELHHDVEVAFGVFVVGHRLFGQVAAALAIGIGAGLFAPGGGTEEHVGQFGGVAHETILHHQHLQFF